MKLRSALRRLVPILAVGYAVALIVYALFLRLFGDLWWVAHAAQYVPRAPLAIPLPLLALSLLLQRRVRLLWTQLAAALVLLFPLLGFAVPGWSKADPARPKLRLLSYNVNSGYADYDAVVAAIEPHSPDLVFIQEIFDNAEGEHLMSLLRARYAHVERSGQFAVASRHPLSERVEPERIPHDGKERSARFVRYLVDTPLGRIAAFNVHPVSPRSGFLKLRRSGWRGLLSGASGTLESDGRLRATQIARLGEMARRERHPVVIAGDTNLPGLSPSLAELSDFDDAFEAAGWGFGYTYPAGMPWMRIDRIFTSPALCAVHFEVGSTTASDHLYVVADIQRCEP